MQNNILLALTESGEVTDISNISCSYLQIELLGNHAKEKNSIMLVSKSSLSLISEFTWYLGSNGYPITYGSKKAGRRFSRGLGIHKMLLNPQRGNGLVVDHINRNKLDNRIENLRLCTPKENSYNTSRSSEGKYKGVTKNGKYWNVCICKDGQKYEMKKIENEIEAAKIYDAMAEELFGQFAGKNFPDNY